MRQKSQKDWFVLCTKARQELKVLECLNQLGIETYTPTKIVLLLNSIFIKKNF